MTPEELKAKIKHDIDTQNNLRVEWDNLRKESYALGKAYEPIFPILGSPKCPVCHHKLCSVLVKEISWPVILFYVHRRWLIYSCSCGYKYAYVSD